MTTLISTDLHHVVALGFWLPCGRGNFYHNSDDKKLLLKDGKSLSDDYKNQLNTNEEHGALHASVFSRLIKNFDKTKIRKPIPIIPELRRTKLKSDPEGLIVYLDDLTQIDDFQIASIKTPKDQPIERIIFIANDKGFNILLAVVSNSIDDKVNDEINSCLTNFIISKIVGSKPTSISNLKTEIGDNDENYDGTLTFFQLNLITEGLFNPNFDPRNFFDSSASQKSEVDVDTDFTLSLFAEKIISPPINIAVNDHFLAVEKFCNNLPTINPSTFSHAEDLYDHIFRNYSIINDILREFLKNVSTDCLLDLKWDVESCRKALLNGMLSYVHKQDKLNQLESKNKCAKALYMNGANEAQLYGYAMLIAAKFPIIININLYVEVIFNSYENEDNRKEVEFLFKDWFGLVKAINENVSRLEGAIAQSRMDSLLLEQQQMRAEQETMAEIERVRQRNGNTGGGGGDEESSAISLNNNDIAMMALLLAILLSTKVNIFNPDGTFKATEEIYVIFFKFLSDLTNPSLDGMQYLDDIYLLPISAIAIVIFFIILRIVSIERIYIFCKTIMYKGLYILTINIISIEFLYLLLLPFKSLFLVLKLIIREKTFPSISEIKDIFKNLFTSKNDILEVKLKKLEESYDIYKNNKEKLWTLKARECYVALFLLTIILSLSLTQYFRQTSNPNLGLVLIQILTLFVGSTTFFLGIKFIEKRERIKKAKEEEEKNKKKIKYYYEMDVRIQRPIDKVEVNRLTSGDFIYIDETISGDPVNIQRDSYRTEYLGDNEIHHKIYFEVEILLNTSKKFTAYLTYDIIEQKRASEVKDKGHGYFFNEFRLVCLTENKLENKEIIHIEKIVKDKFINERLTEDYELKCINDSLSIFGENAAFQLKLWSENQGKDKGKCFNSGTEFMIPKIGKIPANISSWDTVSPNVAWVSFSNWNVLTEDEKASFKICPDFIIEFCSNENMADLKVEMKKYFDNGMKCGLFINRETKTIYFYQANGRIEESINKPCIDCIPELPNFKLQMASIW